LGNGRQLETYPVHSHAGQPHDRARHPFREAGHTKTANPFYLSPEWRALVAEIIRERGARCEDPACRFPGRTGIRLFGDHIVELADGGAPLDKANVMLRCGSCHTRKTNAERARRMRA